MPIAGTTAAIILAAGTSSRMGTTRNKLLLPLAERPVLAHVIEVALASRARPVLLVLGHQSQEIQATLQPLLQAPELLLVENHDYLQGQSTSLKAGLRALQIFTQDDAQSVEGVIFLLGDQPMVTATLIDQLIMLRQTQNKRIALPLYQGQRGNPVVFALDLAQELLQTSGDEGGRSVLRRYPEEIAALAVDNAAANFDVDTWEAYQAVLAAWEQQTHL